MKKRKTLSFEITMPNVGSWNGVWTGKNDPLLEKGLIEVSN